MTGKEYVANFASTNSHTTHYLQYWITPQKVCVLGCLYVQHTNKEFGVIPEVMTQLVQEKICLLRVEFATTNDPSVFQLVHSFLSFESLHFCIFF